MRVNGHQYVRFLQMMMWWCSNLGYKHSGPRPRRLLLENLLIETAHPLPWKSDVFWRDQSTPDPPYQTFKSVLFPHGIIRPPRYHLYTSQHTEKKLTRFYLTRHFQSPTPLPLPCLCHTCQITVDAAKLLQQKYLLMQPSAYSPRLPDTQSLFYYGELIYLYCWDHRYTLHRHSKRSFPISKTTEHDLILIKKQKSHEHTQLSKIA